MSLPSRFCVLLLMAFFLLPQPGWSQFSSGIQGTVIDPASAVIPGARVIVLNVGTGVTRETTSSADGIYRLLGLGAGTYTIKVSKESFVNAEQANLELAVNEIRKVDFTLSISGVAQTVSVAAEAPVLDTEQGRISSQITSSQLKELPIPNRNLINLMVIQPGVSGRNVGNEMFGSDAVPGFNANGTRMNGNSYTLDDSNINSISRGGRPEVTPNVETIAEVRVTTNNFSAEQGRNMGAQISIVSKTGSNDFHGSVWNYHSNNVLQSRNFFTGVPVNRRNQFGYGVGGPIFRNKTFFYTTYEGARRSGATSTTATVETPQIREYVLRTRPNSIAANIMGKFRPAADPTFNFQNQTVDGIFMPALGSARYDTIQDARSNQYTVRVDHELRPGKDRLYGYFYRLTARTITPGIRPDFFYFNPTAGTFGNLVYSWTISPRALNETRLSVVRFMGQYCVPQNPTQPFGERVCNDRLNKQVPGLNITGIGTLRDVNVYPGGWFPTEYQLKDTFSLVRGTHAIKIGGELRRAINILWHTSSFIPIYSFNNLVDFVNDRPFQMTRTVDPRTGLPTTTRADMLIWEGAVFVQDDWKLRRNLTLNLGLRYEYYGPYTDTQDRYRNFVPGTGSYVERLATGKVDVTPRGWDPDLWNFAPRFGFAWDIGGKGKNVVRGGYGISYDRIGTVSPATYRTNPPLAAQAQLGTQFGTTFTYSLGDPSKPYLGYPIDPGLRVGLDSRNGISGARVDINAIDNDGFTQPYGHNWFLGLQRSLPGQMVVEVSWIGSAGHHLMNIANVNRYTGDFVPDSRFTGYNPSFSAINMTRTTSNSIYHGATLAVRRQFSGGLSFQANYTFGKALMDSESEEGVTSFYDVNNRNLDRSVASFDVRQRAAFSGVWEMPFLKHCSSWACKVAGGWQLSGYGVLEQGLPINVFTSASYSGGGDYNGDGTNSDRPNAPSSTIPRSGFSQQNFLQGIFKVADFPVPARGNVGTLGRNAFRGPGFARIDLSLAKNFRITERIGSTVRLESLNAFNRVNLNDPTTNMTSNNFGKTITARDARVYMLSLRVSF